jgi:hypothetical protein
MVGLFVTVTAFVVSRKGTGRFPQSGPRNKRAGGEVKTQRQVGGAGNADACRGNNGAGGAKHFFNVWIFGNQERGSGIAQIRTIEVAFDLHGLAQFRRAVGQVRGLGNRPLLQHEVAAKSRLDGANQKRLGNAGWPADGVDAVMVTVNEIHIGVAGWPEHDAIALGQPGCGVAGGVVLEVGFGFDDNPATGPRWGLAEQPMPKQSASDEPGRGGVEGAGKGSKVEHRAICAPEYLRPEIADSQ